MVSVPPGGSYHTMAASDTSRHSREPPAGHVPRPRLTLGSDAHAIKLTRAKAAPLQRILRARARARTPNAERRMPNAERQTLNASSFTAALIDASIKMF